MFVPGKGIKSQINTRENRGGNPETLATFGTQDTGRRQTKRKNTTHHRKIRKSNTDRTQNRGEPMGLRKISSSHFL